MLLGAHVSSAGGISKAIDRVEEIGGNAVQVFTQSPQMWKPTAHTAEELARFRKRRREARVRHVACHALYLVNLASRDRRDPHEVASTRSWRRWRRRGASERTRSSSTSARISATGSTTR